MNSAGDPDTELPQTSAEPQPATKGRGVRAKFQDVRDRATVSGVCLIAANAAVVFACGGTLPSVRLQPEAPTTVHVGETIAVQLPAERHYHLGSAGSSLALMKQLQQHDTTIYIYRAVEAGNHTLVASPRDPGPGGCISCVTVHYFVKVIRSTCTRRGLSYRLHQDGSK
jgi:hypothetical protein